MDVVVTYFYEQSVNGYNRNKENYINRFSIWASNLKNEMIVFVQEKNANIIKQIRKKYINQTKIVIIDDNIIDKFSEYNELIRYNINNSNFKSNILTNYFQHTSFEYCFVWMLKIYFINEASKMLKDDDNIIYIDFGLTELKNINLSKVKLSTTLTTDKFDTDKINLFKYPIQTIYSPGYEFLEYSMGYIYACIIILNRKLVNVFYNKYFEFMKACLLLGFNPVDQDILYMLQRMYKDDYNLIDLNEDTKNILKFVFDVDVDDDNGLMKCLKKMYNRHRHNRLINRYLSNKRKHVRNLF